MARTRLLAGIDAGGASFKLGVADETGALIAKTRIRTTNPAATLSSSVEALRAMAREAGGEIAALGVASFGPVDIDPASPRYGVILQTPKPGWSGATVRASLAQALSVPVSIDTDVNAALRAERLAGAATDAQRAAYVTIGTGVGVGVCADEVYAGQPYHPELGHMRVERHPEDAGFDGVCRFHRACLEGVLSAPALAKRFGALEALGSDHPCWRRAGWYLAQLCLVLALGFRVERIVLGGGVMNAAAVLRETRVRFAEILNGYLPSPENDPERLIVRAALGDDAGLHGAIALARTSLSRR